MSATEPNRRQRVLDAIRDHTDPVTLGTLAAQLGVHANTVRFHVDRLLESGQIEQVDVGPSGPGRPAAHFRATRRMDPHGPRRYRTLAQILLGALAGTPDRRDRAADAGRAWGRGLAEADQGSGSPSDRLVQILDEAGFSPQQRGPEQIALRHCPFLELAQERTDIVCPIHLGLMQGALAAWGSDVDAVRLEAFVEPDLCLAHLGATRGS